MLSQLAAFFSEGKKIANKSNNKAVKSADVDKANIRYPATRKHSLAGLCIYIYIFPQQRLKY